jgi:HlyD family secretion protein
LSMRQGLVGERLGRRSITRNQLVAGVLGLVALVLIALIARDVLFPSAPGTAQTRTVTVAQGSVRAAVTGTGTLVPAAQQNLNFRVSGPLTEVDVKVGDHVNAGQVLAKIDPKTYQTSLDQANAGLQQAQATLNNTLNGNAVQTAEHSLEAARVSYSDTVTSVNLSNQQDGSAVAADQSQLAADQSASASAQGQLPADQQDVVNRQVALNEATTKYVVLDDCQNHPTGPNCAGDQSAVRDAQLLLDQAQQKLSQDSQASAKVGADQQKVGQDQLKQSLDQVSGQKQVDQAQSAITQAQDQLNSQTIQRPNTIASQEAGVASAQAQVQNAQNNLQATTLTAPADATVMSLSGAVGESVGGSGGLTAQAPGTSAPQPAGASASAAGGAATAGGATGASSGGSSGFIVLGNLSGLEVVAPFAEADAARVQSSQEAAVTFDALPGLSLPAHVLAVAAASTVVSNVTNYYATLTLDQPDQRLKSGMTANASVVVNQATGVLVLPNLAITRIGGQSYVNVLGQDGKTQTRVQVQTGTVGDTNTEIVSGVSAGDRVVIPQLRLPTQTGGGRGTGGGGGAVRVG